jgi:hypothetical protein
VSLGARLHISDTFYTELDVLATPEIRVGAVAGVGAEGRASAKITLAAVLLVAAAAVVFVAVAPKV